jgi:hypothetical protein
MDVVSREVYNDLANLGHNMANIGISGDATIEDLCANCVRNIESVSDPLFGYCLACVNNSNYLLFNEL